MACNVDFDAIASSATETLRELWKSCSDSALKAKIEQVATALDEIEGDRKYLAEQFEQDEQQAWRDLILSY